MDSPTVGVARAPWAEGVANARPAPPATSVEVPPIEQWRENAAAAAVNTVDPTDKGRYAVYSRQQPTGQVLPGYMTLAEAEAWVADRQRLSGRSHDYVVVPLRHQPWAYIDGAASAEWCSGLWLEHEDRVPSWVTLPHGDALLYSARLHSIFGSWGAGKSTVVRAIAATLVNEAHRTNADTMVVLIDAERSLGDVRAGLLELGIEPEAAEEYLTVFSRSEVSSLGVEGVIDAIERRLEWEPRAVVIIDSIGKFASSDNVDADDDAQWSKLMDDTARRLAAAGAAVVMVDHAGNQATPHKPADRPAGTHRKMDDIDGAAFAAYIVEKDPTDPRRVRRIRLRARKDNQPSGHAVGADVADLVLEPGAHRWEAPADRKRPKAPVIDRATMSLVYAYVAGHAGCSQRAVERGKAEHGLSERTARQALAALIADGFVDCVKGRNGFSHKVKRAWA